MSETVTRPDLGEVHTTGDYHATSDPVTGPREGIPAPRPADYHATGEATAVDESVDDGPPAVEGEETAVAHGDERAVTRPLPGKKPLVAKDYHATGAPERRNGSIAPQEESADAGSADDAPA